MTSSYAPQIDGVANTCSNYSKYLEQNHEGALLIAPKYKTIHDNPCDSPMVKYPSIDTSKWLGYPFGFPIAPRIVSALNKSSISLLHMLDPLISAVIARELKNIYDLPTIVSYNTKFDSDIHELVKLNPIANFTIDSIINNINSCDEVWAVSNGAAENLYSLGYEGDIIIMPNGVDMPREKASLEDITKNCSAVSGKDLVFLFVGRMIEGKGIFDIIFALQILKDKGVDFKMVFIGDGRANDELKALAKSKKVFDRCIFLGKIYDRKVLQAWYTRADLFLFPSEYDTNGLVVGEAAASGTPSLLIRGSAAAENVIDGVNGFLTKRTPHDMSTRILEVTNKPDLLNSVGKKASEDLYLSWEDATDIVYERYQIVMDNYHCGKYQHKKLKGDNLLRMQAKYMSATSRFFPFP